MIGVTGRELSLIHILSVVMLEQGDHLDDQARVMDAVHPGLEEYEWASQPAIRDIHAGLLSDIDLHAQVGTCLLYTSRCV